MIMPMTSHLRHLSSGRGAACRHARLERRGGRHVDLLVPEAHVVGPAVVA